MVWFEHFVKEVELLVGRKAISDESIRIEAMKSLTEQTESHVRGSYPDLEIWYIINKGSYIMSFFVDPLRRSELFVIYATGMRHQLNKVS